MKFICFTILIIVVLVFSRVNCLSIDANVRNQNEQMKYERTFLKKEDYFQDDMILPDVAYNGIIDQTQWWPRGVIPYEIIGNYTHREKSIIQKAINEFHKYTCVRFRLKQWYDTNYVTIQNQRPGCSSYVGKLGGKQLLTLENPRCFGTHLIPMHELMHAVGFHHEQNRSDRDKYITILWENIKPNYHLQFYKLGPDKVTDFGIPYDYNSLLHYDSLGLSVNGKPTIVAKDPSIIFGKGNGLSTGDIRKINIMYKCRGYLRFA